MRKDDLVAQNRVLSHSRNRRGFTLIEVLASISIVGVGTIIFISLFNSSLDLAQVSRNQTVATDLAQGLLFDLQCHPADYVWPDASILASGELAPVRQPQSEGPVAFSAPPSMPLNENAQEREAAFYEKFTWEAYVRAPRPDAAYAEVTVVVRWPERGRKRLIAFTSSIGRTILGGTS